MAAHYLREVRAVRPKGPYFLGGYCLGGTIAYEMAQTLRREGEEVPLVAMLDTYNYSRALQVSAPTFLIQKFGSIRVSQRYFRVFRCFSWVI